MASFAGCQRRFGMSGGEANGDGPPPAAYVERQRLFEILEERYGRRSTIVTSQLPLSAWHEVIGDPTYADAILDRLVHNAHRIELTGESLRRTRGKQLKTACEKPSLANKRGAPLRGAASSRNPWAQSSRY